MVRNVLRLVLAVNSVSKALNRVEKIPICVIVNNNPRVTVHVNSDTKLFFCVKMCLVEWFKMNCSCLLINPCELILM